jgi:hypothetical protein
MSPDSSPGLSRPVQGGLYAAALILIPVLAIGGSDSFRAALDFATGVLSLVSLSASVAWGLIATDRLLLAPRQRLLAQGIHRTTAVASLGFLLLHVTVKISLGHVALIGALIPFGLGVTGTSALIGFGSLAGFLMVTAATTGVLRSALAGNVRVAGRWRPLHMLAYPAWCFALIHGLYAGRPAATWVTTMYCLALGGVAVVVSLRMLPRRVQRRIAAKIMSLTGVDGDGPAAADEQARRDMLTSPLPGAGAVDGVSGAGAANRRGRPTVTAGMDRMDRPGGMNGVPSQRTFEQDFPSSLGQSRTQPPRIAAPSPQLYEAPRPSEPEPTVTSGGGTGSGRGPGMSAAYRAVSLGGESAAPFAERVPMTEEIPVVSETGPLPGAWPTPSPPPPAQAMRPAPADTPAYDTPPSYDATPLYDTDSTPSFGGGYDAGSTGVDTGSFTAMSGGFDAASGGQTSSAYDATAMYTPSTSYDAGPTYDPLTSNEAPASYDPLASNEAAPPYTTSPYDTGGIPAYEETAAMPGLFQPPAGEPWNAPAGERP